jgi:hypothetical protein
VAKIFLTYQTAFPILRLTKMKSLQKNYSIAS